MQQNPESKLLREALEDAQRRLTLAASGDPLEKTPLANFEYYAKLSYWTVDEAVSLSCGRHGLIWSNVQAMLQVSPIAQEFAWRHEIVQRARQFGQLWERTIPGVFIAWARRMQFPVRAELVQAVEALGIQVADWKSAHDEKAAQLAEAQATIAQMHDEHQQRYKELGDDWAEAAERRSEVLSGEIGKLRARIAELENTEPAQLRPKSDMTTRERQSLLKLAVGMAVKKYRFDPQAAKNSAIPNIADTLREVGVPLDEDTIRKYLNEAKELIEEAQIA